MPGAFLCHGLAIGFTSPGLPACLKHRICGIVNIPENVSEVLQRNIPDNRSKKSHPVRIGMMPVHPFRFPDTSHSRD